MSVLRYDMVNQGLTLSETPQFEEPIARLNAKSVEEIGCISYDRVPENIDSINGAHNGSDYIAYTFYCKNMGTDTVTYQYGIYLSSVTKNLDEALYITLYVNGEPATYAKTKKDGSGPERDTVEFLTLSTVTEKRIYDFKPGDITKFTIVIWLNGDDDQCVDWPVEESIIDGKAKIEMTCKIIESS